MKESPSTKLSLVRILIVSQTEIKKELNDRKIPHLEIFKLPFIGGSTSLNGKKPRISANFKNGFEAEKIFSMLMVWSLFYV